LAGHRLVLATAFVAFLAGACAAGVVAPEAMKLDVSNETTIPVSLVVNGAPVRAIPAGEAVEVSSNQLPPLPWDARVQTASGRMLVHLRVNPGDVTIQEHGSGGVGARADLSCGRIDLWSGPPLLGPAPRPGNPGDCDP
jgi:hypothetical protein